MTNQTEVKFRIRKDDQVQVIAGREKGKTGKVLKIDTKKGVVLVEKVNMVKRHVKPTQANPSGGIIEKELPLHYSNVLLFCPKCNSGVRIGIKAVEATAKKGAKKAGTAVKKTRVCKKCGGSVDKA